eukprot:SAG31_NODE_5292_length_2628_cov_1.807434_2_plen_88_part_00
MLHSVDDHALVSCCLREGRWETGGPPMMSAVKYVSQQPRSPWSHDGKGGPDVYPHEINHAFTQRPETGKDLLQGDSLLALGISIHMS